MWNIDTKYHTRFLKNIGANSERAFSIFDLKVKVCVKKWSVKSVKLLIKNIVFNLKGPLTYLSKYVGKIKMSSKDCGNI